MIASRINIKFLILLLTVLFCTTYSQNSKNLIMLNNKNIEVGILTEAGGRIVILRKPGFKNILKSDSSLWIDPKKHINKISAFSDFIAFNGHITWVGPQSEWWTHQNLNIERNKLKADWPPDPYLIYGSNEIISRSDTSIIMVGLKSPVSGLRFSKKISISSSGIVTVTTTAENIRDENVSWDLYMLTRLDGFAQAYVPVDEKGILKLRFKEDDTREVTPYEIIDNYFTLTPSVPTKPKKEQEQEIHLYPSEDFIAGFDEHQMLLIHFTKLDKKQIHSEHGLVELYSYINQSGDDRLLELEVHGAYKTLAPGETMSLTETWKVISYNGNSSPKEQIKFLKEISH